MRPMGATGFEPSLTSPAILGVSSACGAESGAVANLATSPALSLLIKLTAGLTTDERAALVRILGQAGGK